MAEIFIRPRTPVWFVGARTDRFTLLLAGPLISLLLIYSVYQGPAFLLCALLFALFLDLPHVLHTHIRLLANPADYLRHRRRFWVSLLLISALCIVLTLAGHTVWLVAIWVYWQPYHVCKQHYGVATLYARRSGYHGSTRHIGLLLLSGFAAPLLYRIAQGGLRFGEYRVFGETLPFSGLQIPSPELPVWIVLPAYALFGLAIINFHWHEQRQLATRSGPLPGFVQNMLVVALFLYNLAYLFISDLYALILIGTSIHALQYHLVCRWSVKSLLGQATAPTEGSAILRGLHRIVRESQRGPRLWIALFGIAALLLVTEIPSLGVIPLIVVLHHFYLDGLIWKRKDAA